MTTLDAASFDIMHAQTSWICQPWEVTACDSYVWDTCIAIQSRTVQSMWAAAAYNSCDHLSIYKHTQTSCTHLYYTI